MNYIERSQQVKQEILSNPKFLNVARSAFNEEIEPFAFGGTVHLYQIGQLPSGLHLALRAFRTDVAEGQRDLEGQMKGMEYYCQNADYLHSQENEVPKFCIGIINSSKAGILTEDLSNGGAQEFQHHPDNDYALVGADKRKVFVDIDGLFRFIPGLKLKYFSGKHLIRI